MQLRYKVVLLAVVPLLLAAGLLAFVVERKGTALADSQVASVKMVLENARKVLRDAERAGQRAELRHLMAIAQGEIRRLMESNEDDQVTQSKVLDRLRGLSFGEDGYFFVYDLHGKCLMHPRQPALVGRDLWNFRDDTGQLVIQKLIEQATASSEGGFLDYRWQRPSQQRWSQKLGYVIWVPRWGWMIGTGIYLDKSEEITRQIRASSSAASAAPCCRSPWSRSWRSWRWARWAWRST